MTLKSNKTIKAYLKKSHWSEQIHCYSQHNRKPMQATQSYLTVFCNSRRRKDVNSPVYVIRYGFESEAEQKRTSTTTCCYLKTAIGTGSRANYALREQRDWLKYMRSSYGSRYAPIWRRQCVPATELIMHYGSNVIGSYMRNSYGSRSV